MLSVSLVHTKYRIAGNFCLEKIFAQARRGRKFFGELFYLVKIVTLKFLHVAAKQY